MKHNVNNEMKKKKERKKIRMPTCSWVILSNISAQGVR